MQTGRPAEERRYFEGGTELEDVSKSYTRYKSQPYLKLAR